MKINLKDECRDDTIPIFNVILKYEVEELDGTLRPKLRQTKSSLPITTEHISTRQHNRRSLYSHCRKGYNSFKKSTNLLFNFQLQEKYVQLQITLFVVLHGSGSKHLFS
jgi:hypothetical protein